MFVYVDQSVLGLARSGEIELTPNDAFDWVYSNEHFTEAYRGGATLANELLDVLGRAKARKIDIELDQDWKITDTASVLGFQNPHDLYQQFLENIDDPSGALSLFHPLQAYLHGNSAALEPTKFAESFSTTMHSLISDVEGALLQPEHLQGIGLAISSTAASLAEALESVAPELRPIAETRRQYTTRQLSDLDSADSPIVDQIWTLIGDSLSGIKKDSLFGKFQPTSNNEQKNSVFLGILQCYSVLNLVGYMPDHKMAHPRKIPGINSDATHVGYGAFCAVFASGDRRQCLKAQAAYEYFGCHTQVWNLRREARTVSRED